MKNIKIFVAAAMAVMLAGGLSSCEKENGGKSTDEKKSTVTISLSYPQGGDKRGVSDPTTPTSVTTFSTGEIYFYKDGTKKEITQVYNIVSGDRAIEANKTNLELNRVNIADMTDAGKKVTFPNVTGDHVFILANHTVNALKGEDLKTKVLDVVLKKAELRGGDFTNAILKGDAALVPLIAGSDDKKADVTVSPISARIEIKKITETKGGYTFELEAIYINNYYEEMKISGDQVGDLKVNKGATGFNETNYPGNTNTWHDKALAMTAASSVTPATAGKVWSYHIFPSKENVNKGDDFLPHIIVHMKNLKKGSELIQPEYYITIATYGNTKEFKAGNVYTIDELKFDAANHGGSDPEQKLVNCDVTVSIATWKPNTLNPDIN